MIKINFHRIRTTSQVLRHPMSKRPELIDKYKTAGSDLDHPRAVNSNGKVILTVCLSVCMCECMRASKSMRGFLPAFLSPERGYSLSFYKTYQSAPIPWGRSVFSSVYLFVSPGIPCPSLPQNLFPLCLI